MARPYTPQVALVLGSYAVATLIVSVILGTLGQGHPETGSPG